jgi:hypothetical protein
MSGKEESKKGTKWLTISEDFEVANLTAFAPIVG